MKKCKKLMTFMLCFALVFSSMTFMGRPETVEAEETYDLIVGDFKCNYNDDGTLTIMDYTGRAESLTIPATLDGKAVTVIGDEAFKYDWYLKSVTISSGITTIGASAFQASYISSLTIPESVTVIGEYAFAQMDYLTTITLPSGVTVLNDSLFWSCDSLENVYFKGSLTEIRDYVFESTGLKKITLPDSVTEIGGGVFAYCENLTEITIPDSVTEIGGSVFAYCENLTEVTLSKNLTSIPYAAFRDSGITSLEIPEGVTEIDSYAFRYCEDLRQISLPSSLETIEAYAFANTGLEKLTIGERVSSIGWYGSGTYYGLVSSFLESQNLVIEVDASNPYFSSRDGALYNKDQSILSAYPSAHGEVILPDTVTWIGSYAFPYTRIESIKLPEKVTGISEEAFSYCENLESITIPASVTDISTQAFTGSHNLFISVAGGNEYYSSDEDGVLYDKTKETLLAAPGISGEYTIKSGVKVINEFAFDYNDYITEIHTGDTVTTINTYAFHFCTKLKGFTLGDSVTELYYDMVMGCENLRYIEGGKNVTDIFCSDGGDTPFDIDYRYGRYDTAMIIGEEDSGIVQFAIANDLPYMIPGELGDVNCDNQVTAADALIILKEIAKLDNPRYYYGAADCTKDGSVTAADALAILKKVAKLEDF